MFNFVALHCIGQVLDVIDEKIVEIIFFILTTYDT